MDGQWPVLCEVSELVWSSPVGQLVSWSVGPLGCGASGRHAMVIMVMSGNGG